MPARKQCRKCGAEIHACYSAWLDICEDCWTSTLTAPSPAAPWAEHRAAVEEDRVRPASEQSDTDDRR